MDAGPRVWDDHDIWTEIQNALDKNDVEKAAWLLRRYLEYTAPILADNLRVPTEFRGDGRYDLGDLLPNILKQWRRWLEKGDKSAQQWGREKEKEVLSVKRAKAKDLIARTNAEYWAVNPLVHFSQWASLQAHEFQQVVDAFKELLENLRCENTSCKSYLYILPRNVQAEEMRCTCGATTVNLRTKS